ncbi:MAG: FAD-binding protein [Armatimonadetes bacterium]|nr:FAD-binding protein [Armatimonadota bacterium]
MLIGPHVRSQSAASTRSPGPGPAADPLNHELETYQPGAAQPARDVGETARQIEEAVVVGAGPAGLAAAIVLAQRGVKVTVVELRDYFYQRPHHLNLRQQTLDTFAELGVLDDIAQRSGPLEREELTHLGEVREPTQRPPDPNRVTSDAWEILNSPSVMQARISDVEKMMHYHAEEMGVKFKYHAHAILDQQEDGNFGVHAQDAEGITDLGVPDLVVVTDGANSTTREQVGIGFEEQSEGRWYLGGHVNLPIGAVTRKSIHVNEDGSTQRLMATGHARYPSTWISVEASGSMLESTQEERVAQLCRGASLIMGQEVRPEDITWGAGLVTKVQDRVIERAAVGGNLIFGGDAARTGDVWESGGLNLSLTSDVRNLTRLVEGVNSGRRSKANALHQYCLRTRWASRMWHAASAQSAS